MWRIDGWSQLIALMSMRTHDDCVDHERDLTPTPSEDTLAGPHQTIRHLRVQCKYLSQSQQEIIVESRAKGRKVQLQRA